MSSQHERDCRAALEGLLQLVEQDKQQMEITACIIEHPGHSAEFVRMLESLGAMHTRRAECALDLMKQLAAELGARTDPRWDAVQGRTFANYFNEARAEHRAEHTKGMH